MDPGGHRPVPRNRDTLRRLVEAIDAAVTDRLLRQGPSTHISPTGIGNRKQDPFASPATSRSNKSWNDFRRNKPLILPCSLHPYHDHLTFLYPWRQCDHPGTPSARHPTFPV
jgi:hypothetical protein